MWLWLWLWLWLKSELGFIMGSCFSDMKGAKQAVGGVNAQTGTTNNNNDAVDFFYTAQGFQPLFTQVEVSPISNYSSSLSLFWLNIECVFDSFVSTIDFERVDFVNTNLKISWMWRCVRCSTLVNVKHLHDTFNYVLFLN